MSADRSAARLRRIRALALASCALAFALICISAYVRLDAAGLGCADWPACYGRVLADRSGLHIGVARLLHRVGASAALILAFVLAWQCRQPQPLQPAAGRSTALVVLMVVLAAVGIWSADPHRALASFVNILGGLALVAQAWRIVLAAGPRPSAPRRDPLALAGIASLVLTVMLGALIGARFAAPSCAALPACNGVWWPAAEGWAALNPAVVVVAALPAGDPGGTALHLLHRYAALAMLLLLGGAAHRALHQPAARTAARIVLVALTAELLLGLTAVASGLALWLAVAHSAVAGILLAAALWMAET